MSKIFDKLKDNAMLSPNKTALIQGDGIYLTYAQLVRQVNRKITFLKDILDLHIPVTTDEVIFPVPINPNFIMKNNYLVMPKL